MTELRATKGPWPVTRSGDGKRYIVGAGLVEGPDGYDVAEVYADDCDPAEAEANASLIGSSRDLYGAAESAFCVMDAGEHPEVVHKLRAALAKARGE